MLRSSDTNHDKFEDTKKPHSMLMSATRLMHIMLLIVALFCYT